MEAKRPQRTGGSELRLRCNPKWTLRARKAAILMKPEPCLVTLAEYELGAMPGQYLAHSEPRRGLDNQHLAENSPTWNLQLFVEMASTSESIKMGGGTTTTESMLFGSTVPPSLSLFRISRVCGRVTSRAKGNKIFLGPGVR